MKYRILNWRQSIGLRFSLAVLVLVFSVTLVFTLVESTLSYRREVYRLNQELLQIRQSHIPSLVFSLWLTDRVLLQVQIDAIARFPYVSRVEVEDDEGRILFSGSTETSGLKSISEVLVYDHRGIQMVVGELRIFLAQKDIRQEVFRGLVPAIVGHLLIMFTVSAAVLVLFRRQIANPVGGLVMDLHDKGRGGLEVPIRLSRSVEYPDELSELVQAINSLRSNLHAYLKERDLLVAEIHHRIKNDMGFVTALLSLQAEQSDSPDVKQAVQEASQRVSVMARIYERLYGDDNFLEVAIRPLATQMVEDLQQLSALPPGSIGLGVEDLRVPTRLSVGIGIILNELLTNAIKYGTPTTGGLHIDVGICMDMPSAAIEMKIADNGPGMHEDVINGNRRGYGLTIVNALVEQHHGTLVLENNNGSVVVINIPVS